MQTSSSGAQETLMLHGLGDAPLAAFVDLVSCNMYHVFFFLLLLFFTCPEWTNSNDSHMKLSVESANY